jgi:hypothetical protein
VLQTDRVNKAREDEEEAKLLKRTVVSRLALVSASEGGKGNSPNLSADSEVSSMRKKNAF